MIGSTISHYKILEKLGEGGMGIVYKAEDTTLDRVVALKFLPPSLQAGEAEKARFLLEAKAAAALHHQNICSVIAFDESDGQMFIVMEYIEGQTLRERRGQISFKQAIDIGIQIADGLAAAHEKGIVHRDVKPENIMLRKDGTAQIMDFGLAKLRATGSRVNRLTKEGSTVGTAGYMSPEQVQGLDTDHRSDIFSFGVLLHELLTGQLPFKGVHETALAYEIVNVDAAPMSSVNPEIDASLDAIVLECLEKDPRERTQSIAQISVDLKRYRRESSRQRASRITAVRPVLAGSQPTYPAQGAVAVPASRTWIPWSIAAIAILVSIAAIFLSRNTASRPSKTTRLSVTLPKNQEVDISIFPSVDISKDGTKLVYTSGGKLFLQHLDQLEPKPLEGTDGSVSPFFSPDGKWIAFFSGRKLKKISVDAGAPIALADILEARGGTWGRDGKIYFSADAASPILRVSDGGGPVTQVTTLDSSKHERTHRWPRFLPDGKTLLFTLGTLELPDYYEDATIEAVNIETGKRTTILKGGSNTLGAAAGQLLYTRMGVLFAVPFDLDRLTITGTPVPVIQGVNGDGTTGAMHYGLTEDGTLAYLPGQFFGTPYRLARLDQKGNATVFPAPAQPYMDLKLSPDGTRIAVVVAVGKDYDIWIYDISRNTMSRLTFGGANRTPVWTPDGKHIIYWALNGMTRGIYRKAADGTGSVDTLTTYPFRTYINSISTDGNTLVLDKAMPRGSDILMFSIGKDKTPREFIANDFDTWQSDISPDGNWLAYVATESGVFQIYVESFPDHRGKWQISSDGGEEPRWSPDGKRLYYRNRGQMMVVPVTTKPTFSAGQPEVLFDRYRPLLFDTGVSYDITPDGSHFITTRPVGDDTFQKIHVVLNWTSELDRLTSLRNN